MPEARISGHRFHYTLDDGCAVVRPEGACDSSRTEALARLANSPLIESRNLILDLSHAEYVESPGFRWLVRQVRKLESAGRTLVVAGLSPQTERAFRLLRLDRIIPAARDVAEAMEIVYADREAVAVR